MGFAGFVFDMIRRGKENRDLLNLRRERAGVNKNILRRSTIIPPISLEEYERIEKELKEREKEKHNHLFKLKLKIICAIIITLFITLGLLKLFVS